MTERRYDYRVDADNRITSVNADWLAFARENDAQHLTTDAVVGQQLFRFVTGIETQHLYQLIFDRVRRVQRAVTIPFRCDGPAVRRFMELVVSPGANDQIPFVGRTLREEAREDVSLFDSSVSRTDHYLKICSWCKRVDVSGNWLEVELAVSQLELFNAEHMPRITHGVCVECMERARREIDEADTV